MGVCSERIAWQQNDSRVLDGSIQRRLDGTFGIGFPKIRVFEDMEVARLGALALARGAEIAFAPGCYDPDCATGRFVILHEVGHVLQWLAGLVPASVPGHACPVVHDRKLEKGANHVARWLAAGGQAPPWLPRRPQAAGLRAGVVLPLQVLTEQNGVWVFIVVNPKSVAPYPPPGYQRYWDAILNDLVDVPNHLVQAYSYSLQQALAQRAWAQQQAFAYMQQPPTKPLTLPQPTMTMVPKSTATSAPPLPVIAKPMGQTQVVPTASTSSPKPKIPPVVPYKAASVMAFPVYVKKFFSYFNQRDLLALRCVCRLYRDEAETIIWNQMVRFTGVSTIIGGQAPTHPSMKKVIQDHLTDIHNSGQTALMASDQITSKDMLLNLMGGYMKIKINIGSNAGPGILNDPRLSARKVAAPSEKGRPHTKFISGGGSVFVGSPNFTPSALEGGNIETAVSTSSLQAQAFFNRYWQLMRYCTEEDALQFERLVNAFNARNKKMRLALAPFIQIQPFILEELKDAETIVIRMFLISHFKTNDDIVTGLNALARNGAKITVVVDEGQIQLPYVREALGKLLRGTANVTVCTQTSYMAGEEGSIMHDKLILAEIRQGERIRKRVLLGSSGFTTNVMANDNYDLMVTIDEDALFDYYLGHHTASLKADSGIVTKKFVYK